MTAFLRKHSFILALLVLYIGLNTWAIWSWYGFQLNPDGLSYITIADKYAHGDFRHAINGYWGPMLSWLLVPAMWLNLNPIIAAKLLSLLAGAGVVGLLYWVLRRYKVSLAIAYPVPAIMALLFSEWVVYNPVTPDAIMALLIVLLGVGASEFFRQPTRRLGIALGVIGALMFFTKGIGFYLFIATMGLIGLWQWRKGKEKPAAVLQRFMPMALMFMVLVLPFIAVLSLKYNKLTINNAGVFNWNVYGIHLKGAQPIDNNGPLVPPNETAINAWEDPTALASRSPDWNILESGETLTYYWQKILWTNIEASFGIVRGFGAYVAFAFIVLLVGCLQRKWHRTEFTLFALINALMFIGYSLLFIDSRYLWGGVALAVLGTGLFLSQLQRSKLLSGLQLGVAGAVICGSMFMYAIQVIVGSRDSGQDLHRLAMAIKPEVSSDAHVMSDRFAPAFPVCYHLQVKCYNVMNPSLDNADAYYRLLKSHNVNYYMDFHMREDDKALQSFVSRYASFVETHTSGGVKLTLYRIN